MTLKEKLTYYADNYYRGNELISDEEYDAMVAEYKKEFPNDNLDIVGDDLKGITKKLELPVTMGTLAKIHEENEFRTWCDNHNYDWMVQVKLDGNSQLLCYLNGDLIKVISRGNGEFGEDTTSNVSKVNGVIKHIDNFNGYIRGEVILKDSIFEKYFKGDSNPRNTAAGLIKRLDGKDCDKLNFVAYDVFCEKHLTELEKINFLKENNFAVPMWWMGAYVEDIIEFRNNISNLRKELDYGIDGIVIKKNDNTKEDLMRHTPMNNVAFKPASTIAITKVNQIRWQLAGSQLAPVAEVDPVELDDAIISRATLSNINIMNELGIYEGASVEIKRSGMVIPAIVKVLEPKKNAFEIPTTCPVCNGKVEINSSGFPICINPNCKQKLTHRFAKMFEVLGIKGTGEVFLNNINVESVEEFLILCKNEALIIDRWAGGINGRKIVKQIKTAMKTPITVAKFLATFDYKGFDEKKLKLINYSLDEMFNLTVLDIVKIDGFAEITANLFVQFMKDKYEEINTLRNYFNITSEIKEEKKEGLKVCFTGTAPIPRKELTSLAIDNGYNVVDSVTKDLDMLICEDINGSSSKLVKARKNGTKIVSYDEFLKNLS